MVENKRMDEILVKDKKLSIGDEIALLLFQLLISFLFIIYAYFFLFGFGLPFLLSVLSRFFGCLFLISVLGLLFKQRFAYKLAWLLTFMGLLGSLFSYSPFRDLFDAIIITFSLAICLTRIKDTIKPQTKSDDKATIVIALTVLVFIIYSIWTLWKH